MTSKLFAKLTLYPSNLSKNELPYTPSTHCNQWTTSKVRPTIYYINSRRCAMAEQAGKHNMNPIIFDPMSCSKTRTHEPLIHLDIIAFRYVLIATCCGIANTPTKYMLQ